MYDKDALQGKTLAELREIGRQFGIKAQMRKQELADKILELSARQQPAVSQPSSDAELSFESTGVKTVRPVGRPKKQTAPPAEEQTAVRIGRVVQGEPYRKQRGRRPKDNRDGAEQRDPEISATTVETEVARPSTREMRGDSQEGMKRHRRDRITVNKAMKNVAGETDPEAILIQEGGTDFTDIPELPIAEMEQTIRSMKGEYDMSDQEIAHRRDTVGRIPAPTGGSCCRERRVCCQRG